MRMMEFESKLRQNLTSHSSLIPSEKLTKLPYMKDEFPFEIHSSKDYLQDFQHLDHQFHVNGSSSSNPIFDVQNTCFDPFNTYPYGCSSNNVVVVDDLYECKPLIDNGGHGQVMDNFQSGAYLSNIIPQMNNSIEIMGSDQSFIPYNCQEIKPINFIVPDEVSCITAGNGYYKKVGMDKNTFEIPTLMRRSYKVKKKTNVVKGQWTIEEDRVLIQLVEQYGVRKWSHIAQMLPGRIGKQCRERWHNHLKPDIKKDTWSDEEDKILIEAHAEIGNKWAEIAKKLPGRTENSIKNHWNATKRRQYSKRKCRSKYPRGSLLQEYIKTLNLDPNTTRYQRKNSNSNSNINTRSKSTAQPQISTEFCQNHRLVPDFDYSEDPDFCFDENLFEDGCSIDSLIDDISCAHVVGIEDKNLQDKITVDVAPMVEFEVKKELDLVEMISQVNEANI